MVKKMSKIKGVRGIPGKKTVTGGTPKAKKKTPKKKVALPVKAKKRPVPKTSPKKKTVEVTTSSVRDSGPLWGKKRLAEEKIKRTAKKKTYSYPATDDGPSQFEQDAQNMIRKAAAEVLNRPDLLPKEQPKISEMIAKARSQEPPRVAGTIGKAGYYGPHMIVRARAGTGKTWTLVMGLAWMFRHSIWGDVKRELGFEPKPSDQQAAIWDVMDGSGDLRPKGWDRPRTVTYCAFNKAIVKEFGEKYSWMVELLKCQSVDFSFSTINSIGYQTCQRQYKLGWGSTTDYRTTDDLARIWGCSLDDVWSKKYDVIQAVKELVALSKLTLAANRERTPDDKALADLAQRYDIEMPEEIQEETCGLVRMILGRHILVEGDVKERKIDWNDQVWLPVIHRLPVWKRDVLLVDEGQDLNPCQQELALLAGNRIILVGDDRQAIYGFAGADTESMEHMRAKLREQSSKGWDQTSEQYGSRKTPKVAKAAADMGVREERLTMTRRCGKEIVKAVKHIVEDFVAHPDNSLGIVRSVTDSEFMVKDYEMAQYGDMVLCRINAPLIAMAFKLLRAKRHVNIQGRDIGTMFKSIVKSSWAKTVGEFLGWIDRWAEKQRDRLTKKRNGGPELAILQDKVDCLTELCGGADTVKDILRNIDMLFKDVETGERKVCILLSSIHRAKGLESKRVWLLRPELLPHPMATSEWAREQEANLEYVAKTRAIDELITVRSPEREELFGDED